MRTAVVFVSMWLAGCATVADKSLEAKQQAIVVCVKDLKVSEFESMEAFEVCRQVYRLRKIKEQ